MIRLTDFSIDAPRWDQNTFLGRLKHFFNITDPRTVLVSEHELDQAKALVESCRAGLVPPGTSQEQLFYAKKLYDSAFHPDSGEKMNLIGRMSFQVPGGMAITGFMLQFYRTVPAVVFWQWVNQSFNALVNYTNRNAACPISLTQIGVAYVTATSTALATAVGLNLYTKVPRRGSTMRTCGGEDTVERGYLKRALVQDGRLSACKPGGLAFEGAAGSTACQIRFSDGATETESPTPRGALGPVRGVAAANCCEHPHDETTGAH
uniref:Sideroflexin 2 n=1 Tax=Gopherus evgoodei TaxID=1825980 RepID=A0A8C4XZD9_9SAUR